jgi:L-threonylcarbamoyladenylate synthase
VTEPPRSHLPAVVVWPSDAGEQDALVDQAAAILRDGGLVVFPTDTVYGIAADPLNQAAVESIFVVKQRPTEKRIALLLAGPDELDRLASAVPESARELAVAAWPGALTIVLACSRPELGPTIALRWPDHEVPTRISKALGSPLATTSANISSQPSPRTAQDVLSQLQSGYELLIDGGEAPGGVDSTVIDFSTAEPKLLRRGGLERRVIESALGAETASRLLDRE